MDMKQILIAIGIVLGTFVLIVGAVVGIYFYYPEILGFEAPKVANVQLDDKKTIEKDSIDIEQKKEPKKKLVDVSYDSLLTMTYSLTDSLSNSKELIKIYNDSITGLVNRILDLNKNENKMIDSIRKAKRKADIALKDLEEFKKSIKDKDSINILKNDTLTRKNLETFAKIYNNTSPTEVAKILENLSNRKDVAKIIKLMQPKKAGKVLEAMNPEIAADVLIQGSFSK